MANVTEDIEFPSMSSDDGRYLTIVVPAELTRSGYNILAIYSGFLTFFGIFNNGLVLYLFLRFDKLRQPIYYFLLNLSIADMAVSLLASPLTFISNVAGRWLFGQTGCSLYAFLVMMGGFEQIVALAVISLHRCLLVLQPFATRRMGTYCAVTIILLTWLYSLALAIPPAFGWNEYILEGAGTACAIDWTNRKPGNTSYVIFIFVLGLFFPLTVIVSSYGSIIFAVRQNETRVAVRSSENKVEDRATRMVVVMIVLFLVAWSPYSVFSLYVAFTGDRTLPPIVATLPPFVAKACTTYNPIVYFFMNRRIRRAFYELIGYHPRGEQSGSTYSRRSGRRGSSQHCKSGATPSAQKGAKREPPKGGCHSRGRRSDVPWEYSSLRLGEVASTATGNPPRTDNIISQESQRSESTKGCRVSTPAAAQSETVDV